MALRLAHDSESAARPGERRRIGLDVNHDATLAQIRTAKAALESAEAALLAASVASESEPLLVTVDRAAQMLGIGRTKTFELISSGALPAVKIGRSTRVRLDDVRAYAAA